MDVANIEAVEGGTVGTRRGAALGGSSSTVLLSLCELRNDGDALQFLASQLQRFGNRLFVLELNVANAAGRLAHVQEVESRCLPFGTSSDSVLDDLGLNDRADHLEELAQVAGLSALRDLLHENGALVAVVFSGLGLGSLLAVAIAALLTTAAATVSGAVARAVLVVAPVTAGRAGAGSTASAVVVASTVPTASAVSVARAAATGPITVFFSVSTFA